MGTSCWFVHSLISVSSFRRGRNTGILAPPVAGHIAAADLAQGHPLGLVALEVHLQRRIP
jgi:hypothetical protein